MTDVETAKRGPTIEEAIRRITEELTIDVPTTAVGIGQGEHTVREAIARGDIASIRIGRSIRVLTAPLRRQLGLE